jgi:hypothetical protein
MRLEGAHATLANCDKLPFVKKGAMDSANQESLAHAPSAAASRDSFFGWDQLILLATPFPVFFVAWLGYMLGLANNAADGIRAYYVWPAFLLSFSSAFVVPALFVIALLVLLGRNLYLRKPKRLVLYGVVLLGLPATMAKIDADYFRFRLQRPKFEALVAQQSSAMPERSAHCFVFDQVQDNFYFGGANFDPFEKLVLFVSEDIAGGTAPPIESFSKESNCPPPRSLRNIRQLEGRFYMATRTLIDKD